MGVFSFDLTEAKMLFLERDRFCRFNWARVGLLACYFSRMLRIDYFLMILSPKMLF